MSGDRPTLAVVYDRGAVLPFELGRSLRPLAELVFVVADSEHVEQALPVLRALGEVRPLDEAVTGPRPDGVLTFSERMLRATADLTAGWGLPGHSQEVVELVTDKYAQRSRLAGSGVDPVRCRRITDVEDWAAACDHVGLPAVLKPCRGEGSQNTHLVEDSETGRRLVDELLRTTPVLVVEEYLRGRPEPDFGDYVSVESVTAYGTTTHLAVTGKLPFAPPFRETGQFWPSHLSAVEQADIVALAGKAIDALGITSGISHTEVKMTASGPRIIEVNGRLGGNLVELALRASGLDLVALAARVALGEKPEIEQVRPDGVYFQRYSVGPTRRSRLLATGGGAKVAALDGVDRYLAFACPGMLLEAGTGTTQLDLLAGQARTSPEMQSILNHAQSLLTFDFCEPSAESAPGD